MGVYFVSVPMDHTVDHFCVLISLCFLDHLYDFTDGCFVKANSSDAKKQKTSTSVAPASASSSSPTKGLFTKSSRAIIWGLQTRAVQGMMDFHYVCGRTEPSVAAMVYPMAPGDSKQNFYWGHKEVLIPVYKSMADAMAAFPEVDVMVSFASLRSAYDSTIECLDFPQIRTIAIISEGIPENFTRKLIKLADKKGVTIIGPATVGGVKPGCFKKRRHEQRAEQYNLSDHQRCVRGSCNWRGSLPLLHIHGSSDPLPERPRSGYAGASWRSWRY